MLKPMVLYKRQSEAKFCCCQARRFLIATGIVGFILFIVAFGCCFIDYDKNKRRLEQVDYRLSFDAMVISLIAIALANILLVVGARFRLKLFICMYQCAFTAFSIALWVSLAFTVLSWLEWAKQEKSVGRVESSKQAQIMTLVLAFCGYGVTAVIFVVMTAATSTYKRSIDSY